MNKMQRYVAKKKLYMPLFVYCREALNLTTFFVQKNTSESDEEKNIKKLYNKQ